MVLKPQTLEMSIVASSFDVDHLVVDSMQFAHLFCRLL